MIYSAQGMSDLFSFPYGPSSSVATIGNDGQVEDRIGERERGIKGRRNNLEKGRNNHFKGLRLIVPHHSALAPLLCHSQLIYLKSPEDQRLCWACNLANDNSGLVLFSFW